MDWLEAFRSQFVLFMICVIYIYARAWYFNEEPLSFVERKTGTLILVLIIWFVFGVPFRYYMQLPITGLFGYL